MPLTAKRKRFVDEYMIDLNATEAAKRAGFSERSAYAEGFRLLKNDEVNDLLEAKMRERSEKTGISATYVLEGIRDTIERCSQAVAVLDKDGEPTGEYRFDSMAVLRGHELLGKHLKLFTDKVEVSGMDSIADRLAKARAAK